LGGRGKTADEGWCSEKPEVPDTGKKGLEKGDSHRGKGEKVGGTLEREVLLAQL